MTCRGNVGWEPLFISEDAIFSVDVMADRECLRPVAELPDLRSIDISSQGGCPIFLHENRDKPTDTHGAKIRDRSR